MARARVHKDLRALVKELRARGYSVRPTGGTHWGVYDANDNLRAVLPGTPGGGRWLQNLRADLRRQGLID